ncbi:MAG TPA: SpoIIE family protein phosphatase [Chloroflexota bacterium]|nr:SpoIIE family protein phosphatase [Chloroflexota bacterium]
MIATSRSLAEGLAEALERLAAGDLSVAIEIPNTSHDSELAALAAQLNRTIAALRERDAVRTVFGQYVRPAVADALLRGDVNLAGERREITVLVSDVRSFTLLSESLEAGALIGMLNRYFGHMIDAVLEFDGTTDKFLGDGMMVEFNAPISQDFHALRAVLTALRMRERLADFNRDQLARGEQTIRIGIGIHTGQGTVGNLGSEGRKLEYTALGDTVNCAARIESETKTLDTDIVISGDTLAGVAEWVDVAQPTVVAVKGRAQPLLVYGVLGLKPGLELGPALLDLARRRAGTNGAAITRATPDEEHDRARLLREYETRTAAQRATLESVIASMADGLVVTDTRRQVRFCNERAAAALGTTSAALVDRPAETLFAHLGQTLASPERVRAQWERALAAPEERPTFELRLSGARTGVYNAQVFSIADATAGGARVGVGLVLRDVSALEAEHERKRLELERAAAIQQRLLPSRIDGWPGVLEVAHRFRPAVETSGDFFDVAPLAAAEDSPLAPLQIAVGDVAGKGMAAALVTALARSALRATAFLPAASAVPSSTLRLAGQRLHRDVGAQHFVACALAVLEPPGLHHAGPRLKLSNAAQVPVLLARVGAVTELSPPGYRLPLGAQSDGDYQDLTIDLQPGDAVLFSSDGLVEAPEMRSGELFGFDRLTESLSRAARTARDAEDVAAAVWEDIAAWCGDSPHQGFPTGNLDDMTLLVLRVPSHRPGVRFPANLAETPAP